MASVSDDTNSGDVGDITIPGGNDEAIMNPVES